MTILAELMTETATSGVAVLRASNGIETRVGALTIARLWTLAVDDTVRFGYLGRDLRDAAVVLEDGVQDVVRIGRSLRYRLLAHSDAVSTADSVERLCISEGCTLTVVSAAVDTCEDHLDLPMRAVTRMYQSGNLSRPAGCADDEAAIVQLSRERRVHLWTEDIARRELEAAGERRDIARRTEAATA